MHGIICALWGRRILLAWISCVVLPKPYLSIQPLYSAVIHRMKYYTSLPQIISIMHLNSLTVFIQEIAGVFAWPDQDAHVIRIAEGKAIGTTETVS